MTPIAYLCSTYENVNVLEARKYLGMFGLDGARHLINISELSGGEKLNKNMNKVKCKKQMKRFLSLNPLNFESVICNLFYFR